MLQTTHKSLIPTTTETVNYRGETYEIIAPEGWQPNFARLVFVHDGERERPLLLPLFMVEIVGLTQAVNTLTGFTPDQIVSDSLDSIAFIINREGDDNDGPAQSVLMCSYSDIAEELWDDGPAGVARNLWDRRIPAAWFGLDPEAAPVPGGMRPRHLGIHRGTNWGCGRICRRCYEVDPKEYRHTSDVAMVARRIIEITMDPSTAGDQNATHEIADLAAWAGGITDTSLHHE